LKPCRRLISNQTPDIFLQLPQALRTLWLVSLAFIGILLIIWTILTLSLDSLHIGSTLSFCPRRLTRRNVKKPKYNIETKGQLHPENCDSNFTLPEDYFQSKKRFFWIHSNYIYNSVKEDEKILRYQRNTEQGTTPSPAHNSHEHTLNE